MRRFCPLLIVTLVFASPVLAQPLADKVPANPIFYFGWRGSGDLGSAYAESHLKAILDQSNIPAVFNDMIPRAIARVGRENLQAAEKLRTATSIASPMWKHPCAVFLADVDPTTERPGPGTLKAGVLCQAGEDAKELLTQLQKLVVQTGKSPIPIRAFQSGDIVALTFGYSEGEDAVALATAKSLKSDSAFAAGIKNVQQDSVLSIYVNCERIWTVIDDAVAKNKDPEAQKYWPKIRDAIGLPGLKRIFASGSFDGKDWMEQAFIDAPSPHVGLLTLLDAPPLTDDLLKLAPAESDRVMAGTFDIAKLVAIVRAAAAQIDPEAGQNVEKVFSALSIYIGRDFQKDVLDPLGDRWLCYSSPNIAGRGLLGSILINQLDDPKKAESGILSTQIAAFNTAAGFLPRYITLRAQNLKSGDLSINYIAVPLISPAWCVNGSNLYVSLFPQNIISAARFTKNGGKSILDNPNFTAVRKRLGGPSNLHGISYTDLTQTVGEGYQGVVAMSRLALGMGDLFGVKSPEPVIPPLDVLLQHVGPSGGISWVDEAGWHSKTVSSFPCSDVFSGGGGNIVPMLMQAGPALGALGRH